MTRATTKADRSKLRASLTHPSGRVVGLTAAQRERLLGLGLICEDGTRWSVIDRCALSLYAITAAGRRHLAFRSTP